MIIIDTKATLNRVCNDIKSIIQEKYQTSPKQSKFKEIFAKALNDNTYAASCSRIPFSIEFPILKNIDDSIKESLKSFRIKPLESDEYLKSIYLKHSERFTSDDSLPMTKDEMISIINHFFDTTNLIDPMVAFPDDGGLSKEEAIRQIETVSDDVFNTEMTYQIDLAGKQEDEEYWHYCPVRKYEHFYHVEAWPHTQIQDGISDLNIESLIKVADKVISEHCLSEY